MWTTVKLHKGKEEQEEEKEAKTILQSQDNIKEASIICETARMWRKMQKVENCVN